MIETRPRKLFVNLAVSDLPRTQAFFQQLGFRFDARFTDDKAACMVISEEAYAMLLVREFFQGFTARKICDTNVSSEALLCISADSRAEVDDIVHAALAAGGAAAQPPQDHGFMYGWSFYDLDGHHWEVVYMDPGALLQSPAGQASS